MFKHFNKASAGTISAAITSLLLSLTTIDPATVGALGTVITGALIYLVPNR